MISKTIPNVKWGKKKRKKRKRKTHQLIVKLLDDLLARLPRMKHHLYKHNRLRLQNFTDQHLPTHGRHGALNIGRRSPRRKVLRQHGKRPRESPYRNLRRRTATALLLLLLLRLSLLAGGPFGGIEEDVGLRGVDALQG